MYRVISNILIQQNPSNEHKTRTQTFAFSFCHSYECESGWRDLTNNGKLVLPKALYFRDQSGALQPLKGSNINIGGFSSNEPLLLRGDSISIAHGYKYFESGNNARETVQTAVIFNGYISKVKSAQPLEVELEDNMWLLKQTPVKTKTYSKTDTLESIMRDLIAQVNAMWKTSFTVSSLSDTVFDTFPVGNEHVAQVLYKLRKKYGFEFFFRGDALCGGVLIYSAVKPNRKTFEFQRNIISDDLEYVRKDDIFMSALAHNTTTEATGALTKDGKQKTKNVRLEVLVTIQDSAPLGYTFKEIKTGDTVPDNEEGERHEFVGLNGSTAAQLAALAYGRLKQYYYTGLRGSFTTFGLPFVQMGDEANLVDPILPERNGVYKIKKVEYSGGVDGLRQKVHLDFRLNL
jgi:hypothetical protein